LQAIQSKSRRFLARSVSKRPGSSRRVEEKSPGSVWKQSVWSLEVLPTDGNEWLSLEDGLTCLLKKLMPAKDSLRKLSAEYDVVISCGHFYSSFGGGLTLSPKILELLAQFGLKLRMSNYWSDDEAQEHRGQHCRP
jgi:hypothetical protein